MDAFPGGHCSTLERSANDFGRFTHHRVGEVCVLERDLRTGVPQQAADSKNALSLPQSERSIRVAKIMETYVGQVRFVTNASPETTQPAAAWSPTRTFCLKKPCALVIEALENLPGGAG